MRIEGTRAVLDVALVRANIAGLMQALPALERAEVLDIHAAGPVDSAGLAWLSLARARAPHLQLEGTPAGFEELRQAYRLDGGLDFTA